MKKNKRFSAVLIGVGLLVIGIVGAIAFVKTKPQAKRNSSMSSMVPVIETVQLSVSSLPRIVEGLGTVIADKLATMQSEVSGRIVAVSDTLVEGGRVRNGEVLIEIEASDYQLALAKAEASLLDAQSNLRLEEGNQAVARHEMTLIGEDVDEAYKDLMLREPQLKSAQAAVKSAQATLDSARLDLERTEIKAPFDAVIVSVDADVGDYAQPSTKLVELAATDRYFIQASVPLSSLEPLPMLGETPYSVAVTLSDQTTRAAQTYKLLPDLTETGRMAQLLLTVDHPYDSAESRPLLLNEVVRFRVQGEMAEGVSLIPRTQLRDGDVIWMIDGENKLRIIPADVLQGYADEVLVRIEGSEGMEVVTTDIAAAVEGMQLRRVGESAPSAQNGPSGKRSNDPSAEKQGARQ